MKKLILVLTILISAATSFISCNKTATNNNSSATLSLLQQTWTRRSTVFYTIPTTYVLWSSTATFTFSPDLNFYESSPPVSVVTIPYRLLGDDSTLIFTYPDTIYPHVVYDTNYITSITNHQLVLHGFWPRTTFAIKRDTLWR